MLKSKHIEINIEYKLSKHKTEIIFDKTNLKDLNKWRNIPC